MYKENEQYKHILGVSNGVILPGSQKEDSVKEQSFGIIYNPQYLFYVSDTGDIKKYFQTFMLIMIKYLVMIVFYLSVGLLEIQKMRMFS
jgi:hypothetical protein